MVTWKCWLDEPSIQRFRQELQLHEINNEVQVPGEHDLPVSHVRQLALDAFKTLARQERPELDPARLQDVMDTLQVVCEPVAMGDGAA